MTTTTNSFMEKLQQMMTERNISTAATFNTTARNINPETPTFGVTSILDDGTITMTAVDNEFGQYFEEMNKKYLINCNVISMCMLYMDRKTHQGAKQRILAAMGLFSDVPTTGYFGRKHDNSRTHQKFLSNYTNGIRDSKFAGKMLTDAEWDLRHARNDGERAEAAWECVFWKWIQQHGDMEPQLDIISDARAQHIIDNWKY